MARKTRSTIIEQQTDEIIEQTREVKYQTAVYARKSLDDEESLDVQVRMLLDYIEESEDLILYKVFSDNGQTGTNFDRPAFNQMIEEMQLGRFNTIIVKDGSRLGRNYLEAGAYMETIFPKYNIRFISVNDRFDSVKEECIRDGLSLPLKNIMNEQYSKDLSRKLSPAFRVRQMEGKFIGGLTTYGYLKDPTDKNKLIVDNEIASVIRRIFISKIEGMSDGAIAKELNGEEILSPFAYRYAKGLVKAEKYKSMPWKRGTISQMLTNPIYTGNMVQGRTRQSLSMHEKKHSTPKNEWIVVENTHEAIISQELFDQVSTIIKERKEKYHQVQKNVCSKEENLLKGKIYCADCGRAMELTKSTSAVATNHYYRCKLFGETGGQKCSIKSIRKDKMENTVLTVLLGQLNWYCNVENIINTINLTDKAKQKLQENKESYLQLSKERQKNVMLANGLNEDYQNKILDDSEYCFLKTEYVNRINELDQQMDELKAVEKSYSTNFSVNRNLSSNAKKYLNSKVLTRDMAEAFISRIEVSDEGHIIVKINCKDEIERMIEIAKERGVDLDDNTK